MCPSLSFLFFPPVVYVSVIFLRFSSLPLSYLLLCIRIFYVFDTRMIRYWRNLLFHCDRPWILCNLFTFRAMLLNILELLEYDEIEVCTVTRGYIILNYTWWKLEMPTRCRTYEKMVRGALGSLSIQTSYQTPVFVGREPQRSFLFCSKDPGSVSPHSPT